MSASQASSVAGLAYNPTPAGLAMGIGGSILGGKGGGKKVYEKPQGNFGNYSIEYKGNTTPFKTDDYTIKTDKANYNLLPELGVTNVSALPGMANKSNLPIPQQIEQAKAQQILAGMQGDQAAINQFNQKFTANPMTQRQINGIGNASMGITTPAQYNLGLINNMPNQDITRMNQMNMMAQYSRDIGEKMVNPIAQAPQQQSSSYTPSAQLLAQIAAARSQQ